MCIRDSLLGRAALRPRKRSPRSPGSDGRRAEAPAPAPLSIRERPRDRRADPGRAPGSARIGEGLRLLVLVVDDNLANLKLLRVALELEGYDSATAVDAQEALRVLEKCRPDIILMDIQLPGMDGLDLSRKLKADPETSDIVILAVTCL